jgi:hypothetical protein
VAVSGSTGGSTQWKLDPATSTTCIASTGLTGFTAL